ncbi:hypothetical protein CY91_04210 [Dehalococcoides mccartyi]|nr:hypothetical protein CY91_04210 [Dehalococcoides mccartyi]OBW62851.1 MAG: hypothetical protein A9183_00270 [Dehalococcoides mccartyi]
MAQGLPSQQVIAAKQAAVQGAVYPALLYSSLLPFRNIFYIIAKVFMVGDSQGLHCVVLYKKY